MKQIRLWFVGLLLSVSFILGFGLKDDAAYLVACDVGQGDALLLHQGFTQVLIDTGENNGRVFECLGKNMPFWDRTLEVLVISHPQSDHMGAAAELIERYRVLQVVVPDVVNDTDSFWMLVNLLEEKEIPVAVATQGLEVRVGEMRGEVLWPEVAYGDSQIWEEDQIIRNQTVSDSILGAYDLVQPTDVNEASVVMVWELEGIKGVVTGDISVRVEAALLGQGVITDVGWVKVAHHGSKTSNSQAMLESLDPELAVIMVGKNNRYGHPSREVLERLESLGARVVRTDETGTVRVRFKNGTMELLGVK